jgi:hypothetical protein
LDPSTTIRRAASAAYQELVGRQSLGKERVPHGISVLSVMDYQAVGSRRGAFECAAQVAALDPRYRAAIIEWSISRAVGHWEERGREGAAKLLGILFSHENDGVGNVLRTLVVISYGLANDRLTTCPNWTFSRSKALFLLSANCY